MKIKKTLKYGLGILFMLGGLFFAGPRPMVTPPPINDTKLPADLDAYLAAQEARYPDIKSGTTKRIVWAGKPGEKTEAVLVSLHGYSASRGELAPIPTRLAKEFGMNLFETRLAGHGHRTQGKLGEALADEWLQDADEAYRIARRLGNKVIFLASSTGAPLVLWVNERYGDQAGFIFISPNFGVKDPNAHMLLWPWSEYILEAVMGKQRSWKPVSELHGKYWTTSYKTKGLIQMAAVVDFGIRLPLENYKTPTLIIYTKNDGVLNLEAIQANFNRLASKKKWLVDLPGATQHVLAGDAVSPEGNRPVMNLMIDFLEKNGFKIENR